MIRELYLATGLYDNKVLTLCDNESLQIKIVGKTYPNVVYYFKAKNGTKIHELKFLDNLVTIQRENLTYGKLKGKIIAMADNIIVKEIAIEDLILQELNKEIRVIPEFENIKTEFEKIKCENNELKDKIKELEILCEKTKQLVLEISGLKQKVGI